MSSDQLSGPTNLHRKLGVSQPPAQITQQPFEGNGQHLRRLARLQPGEKADINDLWTYIHDLRSTDIQGPLFVYLLPFCLQAWRDDLSGMQRGYDELIDHLYPVLADPQIFNLHLSERQREVVTEFLRQTILEELDHQRGLAFQGADARPYRWFGALTTYGVLRPDLSRLWRPWWALDTIGRAIGAVQYISCLMYPEKENRVFAPWNPNHGGGPPCLWEFEGHLYAHSWLEPNVNFLKETLTVQSVGDLLLRAVERLLGQPEYAAAATVQKDFPLRVETVRTRCAELPQLLATVRKSGRELSWPE